jgi:hypothetical protein
MLFMFLILSVLTDCYMIFRILACIYLPSCDCGKDQRKAAYTAGVHYYAEYYFLGDAEGGRDAE